MSSLSVSSDSNNYFDQVPKDTTEQMLGAGVSAFIAHIILFQSPVQAMQSASVFIVTSAIHGLVTPLFKQFADDKGQLSFPIEMLRTSVAVLGGVGFSIVIGHGCAAVPLSISLIFNGIHNLRESRRSIQSTNVVTAIFSV